MDSTPQTIFSYCVGGLALISTITSMLFYCRLYLPSTQLRRLDKLIAETKDIYHKANDQSLLPLKASNYAQTRLRVYEDETDTLREVTYRTGSCFDTLLALLRGHAKRIMALAKDVRKLRAFLVTTSQREKTRRSQALSRLENRLLVGSEVHTPSESTQSIDSAPDNAVLSETDISDGDGDRSIDASFFPFDEDPRSTSCFVCSFFGRWSSRSDTGLPSFVTSGGQQDSSQSNASTESSKPSTSTLVDGQARTSAGMSRSWLSLVVGTFLRTPTDSAPSSPSDDTLQPCRNSVITSPV